MTGFLSSFQNLAKNEEKLTSHSKSIYGSISEAGEYGHSMFLGKGNQITYLPMPRKYLEAYTTCIVPSYTISIRLYKLIGWTMIYVWSVT